MPYNWIGGNIESVVADVTALPFSFTASHSGMMVAGFRKLQAQTYGSITITCDNVPSFSYNVTLYDSSLGYTIDSRAFPIAKGYKYNFIEIQGSTGVQIRYINLFY